MTGRSSGRCCIWRGSETPSGRRPIGGNGARHWMRRSGRPTGTRAQGMSMDKMARALGLPVEEARQRIDAAAPKTVPQHTPRDTTRISPGQDLTGDASTPSVFMDAWSSAPQSSSESQSLSQHAETLLGDDRRRIPAEGHASGVLIVSGDSRPGGNHFGPDVQAVRRVLSSARLECWELACPEPHEVKGKIIVCRPAVRSSPRAAARKSGSSVKSPMDAPLSHGSVARRDASPATGRTSDLKCGLHMRRHCPLSYYVPCHRLLAS